MTILTELTLVITFYLLPFMAGRVIVANLYKKPLSFSFISYFVIGGLFIYITALFLNYAFLVLAPTVNFGDLLSALVWALLILFVPINLFLRINADNVPTGVKKYSVPVIISTVLAFAIYSLWQLNAPYPFNWDIYEHQTLINTIISGKFSAVPSIASDTFGFNGYSTLFHTLLAIPQFLFNLPIFDFWNSLTFAHFTLVVLGAFFLAKVIFENREIAFISALLAAFIFDSNLSFTNLFFIPQTFTSLVFMYLFIQLISEVKRKRLPSFYLILSSSIFLILNHYIVGTMAAFFYSGTYLYFRYRELIALRFNQKLAVEGASFIALLAILFSPSFNLGFINHNEAQNFTLNISDKFQAFSQSYGFLLILFAPLGIWVILKRNRQFELVIFVITLAIFSIVLLQIPYVMKFYTLAKVFVGLLIALGIYTLLSQIKNRLFKPMLYLLLIASLIGIFIANAVSWKSFLEYHAILTQVSPFEIQAGEFLKENYKDKNLLLVSDPATQNILEPISGINTQGGAYMDNQTREILDNISKTSDTKDVAQKLYRINDKITPTSGKRLLAMSGRYFIWQKSTLENKNFLSYNIWYPTDLSFEDRKIIEQFKEDKAHFQLIFENPGIVVFEVNK